MSQTDFANHIEDAVLEISRHQREFDPVLRPDLVQTDPVSLSTYIGKGRLTMGFYPSASVAMEASEIGGWVCQGDGTWRSPDGRSVIEPLRT